MKARGTRIDVIHEREFLSALESATAWGFLGKPLDMHRADGERVLTAPGN